MHTSRRASVPVVVAWIVGLSLGVGCMDTMDPTSPTTSMQTQSQVTTPVLRATGDVTFSNCGSSAGCTFTGSVISDGPGCASNIRGVTHLLDQDGKEIASQSWTINGRVRPGQTLTFTGCCFNSADVNRHAKQQTDVTAMTIECI